MACSVNKVSESCGVAHDTSLVKLSSYNDEELLVRGLNAVWANRLSWARRCFREAVRRDPQDPFTLLELAKCHHQLHELSERDNALMRVRRMFRMDMRIAIIYAQACEKMRLFELALNAYGRASKIDELKLTALAARADLLERMNRLADAQADIDEVRRHRHVSARTQLVRGRLHARSGRLEDAREILEPLAKRVGLQQSTDFDQMFCEKACYALSRVLDRLGEYDQAISVLDSVKRIHATVDHAAMARQAHQKLRNQVTQLINDTRTVDVERLQNRSEGGRCDPIFLIGHPRSGTTLVEQVLDAHPNIVVLGESKAFHQAIYTPIDLMASKHPDRSMADVIGGLNDHVLCEIRCDYWRRVHTELGQAMGDRIFVDKNPILTVQVPLIRRVFPDAKFIYIQRDPRDICLSAFMNDMGMSDWSVNWLTLESTVELCAFVINAWHAFKKQLAPQHIEIRYEDCVGDIESAGRRLCEYLKVEWRAEQAAPEKNARSKMVGSPTYADVARPVYATSVARWRRYESHLAPYMDRLEPLLRQIDYA